jgi:O-antigen ligase
VARAPGRFLGYGLTAALVFGLLEVVFDISGTIIAALGRDPSLTTRVPMWHTLLGMVSNPLLGSGYESFWLDERIPRMIWPAFGYLHNAHNGYLETYLNVGLVGLALIVGGLITGLFKIQRHLNTDLPSGLLRLSLFLTVIIYNWTEATFAAVNNVWVISFIAIVDLSGQWQEQEREATAQPDRRPAFDRAPEKLARWSPPPVPARVVTGIAAGRQFVPRVRAPQGAYGERKALP